MHALLAQLSYRAKAILTGTFIALVSLAQWFVSNPDTSPAIQAIVPAPFVSLVPLALGGLGVLLGSIAVYCKSNGPKPETTRSKTPPPTELTDSPATTLIPTQSPADTY